VYGVGNMMEKAKVEDQRGEEKKMGELVNL